MLNFFPFYWMKLWIFQNWSSYAEEENNIFFFQCFVNVEKTSGKAFAGEINALCEFSIDWITSLTKALMKLLQ